MKIKNIICLMLTVLLIVTTGCAEKSDSFNKEVTQIEKFQNIEYNFETDHQAYFSEYADIVSLEDGYYMLYWGFLYYADKDDMEKIPVCSNLDCKHNNKDCDAYIGDASFIQYYEGSLYYVINHNGMKQLYRRSLDGSLSEKICNMFMSDYIPNITVHRGYAYYSLNSGSKGTLYRVALKKGAKPVKLYKCDGDNASILKIKGYGDGVVFVKSNKSTGDASEYRYDICYYDANENAVKMILENVYASYYVVDNKVYYSLPDGIYCYDVTTDKNELFYATEGLAFLSYDGENFYFDNQYNISITGSGKHFADVVSLEGEFVDTIELNNSLCVYGDSDYLFQFGPNGYLAYNKEQLVTDEAKWTHLSFPSILYY